MPPPPRPVLSSFHLSFWRYSKCRKILVVHHSTTESFCNYLERSRARNCEEMPITQSSRGMVEPIGSATCSRSSGRRELAPTTSFVLVRYTKFPSSRPKQGYYEWFLNPFCVVTALCESPSNQTVASCQASAYEECLRPQEEKLDKLSPTEEKKH